MTGYIIMLLPENETAKTIEDFREKVTGKLLVDGLPPHVSLKRPFTLNDGFSENDLVMYFQNLKYKKFAIDFIKTEYLLGGALVATGQSEAVVTAHKDILKDLLGKTTTPNPEWEGDGYIIHLTILRGRHDNINPPQLSRVAFDRLLLCKLDLSSSRPGFTILSSHILGET